MGLLHAVGLALVLSGGAEQERPREEIEVAGMTLYARCWRETAHSDTVDSQFIWRIGTREAPPENQEWRVRADSVSFDGFRGTHPGGVHELRALPDSLVGGNVAFVRGGATASTAVIRGRLECIETFVEVISMPKVDLVRAHQQIEVSGPIFHFEIKEPIELSTPSGLQLTIPAQDAGSTIRHGVFSNQPMTGFLVRPAFSDNMPRLQTSPLWEKHQKPIYITVELEGVGDHLGVVRRGNYLILNSRGSDIKAGPVEPKLKITQNVVIESHPLEFRVAIRPDKQD